eukprot:TRINITY_DN11489_c0_g1_i1.p1 TRINITY_DN11489_c0_g1~~TRINITY_DN11489_c0_g1_i1.p1  ORF type:complete len:247 (-),score=50.41 TRINITY_DN11489_c0_g1_i1:23-763(-)
MRAARFPTMRCFQTPSPQPRHDRVSAFPPPTLCRLRLRPFSSSPSLLTNPGPSYDQETPHQPLPPPADPSSFQRMPQHFVAIVPPTPVLDKIEKVQEKLKKSMTGTKLKWVPRENLHISLVVLGSQLKKSEDLRKANQCLSKVLADTDGIDLELRTVGVYPKASKPRTLWIGLPETAPRLRRLTKRIQKSWKESGLELEIQTVKAHIVIGNWSDVYVKKAQGDSAMFASGYGDYNEPIDDWKATSA